MRRVAALGCSLATLLLTSLCEGAEPDPHPGRYLAANCTGCHGTQGRSTGAVPAIAGLGRTVIVEAMRAFRSGDRAATVMHQHAKGYSEAQIELLADYFAAQKPL